MPATEAPTEAMIGHGTKVLIETAAGAGLATAFELGELKGAEKPNPTTEKVRATHMGSPGRTHEYVAGMTDYPSIPLPMNWVPGNPTDEFIEGWREGGNENRQVWLVTPNEKTYSFPANIESYSGSIPVDALMEGELGLTVAGAVVRS